MQDFYIHKGVFIHRFIMSYSHKKIAAGYANNKIHKEAVKIDI